jgi:hypothetical protein
MVDTAFVGYDRGGGASLPDCRGRLIRKYSSKLRTTSACLYRDLARAKLADELLI